MKWALISFPKPLCFILLLPLSIFPMCGSVLCTCAQAHTCTQHSNTDRHMEVSSQKHNLSTYTIMCIVWSFHTCFLSIWSGHGGCVCGLVCHVLGYLHPHISAPPYSTHPHPTSPRHTLTYSEKNFIYWHACIATYTSVRLHRHTAVHEGQLSFVDMSVCWGSQVVLCSRKSLSFLLY